MFVLAIASTVTIIYLAYKGAIYSLYSTPIKSSNFTYIVISRVGYIHTNTVFYMLVKQRAIIIYFSVITTNMQ